MKHMERQKKRRGEPGKWKAEMRKPKYTWIVL
jgi:hypothetical protein